MSKDLEIKELQMKVKEFEESLSKKNQEISTYAMLLDLFGKLEDNVAEKDVIYDIIEILKMIFGAKELVYYQFMNNKIIGLLDIDYNDKSLMVNEIEAENMLSFDGIYHLDDNFKLKVYGSNNEVIGLIVIEEMLVSENIKKYINTFVSISHVFGLAISNARKFEMLNKTKDSLEKQKIYLQQLFNQSLEGIILMDIDCNIIKANNSFKKMFAYEQQKLKGDNIFDFIISEENDEDAREICEKLRTGETLEKEIVTFSANGEKIYVELHAFSIKLDKRKIGIYALFNDITERKLEEEKIRYYSFHDQLTGLYNRRYFSEQLVFFDNSRKLPISIIMGDLDNLKLVNDNYGHSVGDEYIKIVAKSINKSVRIDDLLARIGGDEFAVILPETNKKQAEMIQRRIQEAVNDLNSEFEFEISVSTGLAVKTSDAEDLEEVFKEADRKMYLMKNKRN